MAAENKGQPGRQFLNIFPGCSLASNLKGKNRLPLGTIKCDRKYVQKELSSMQFCKKKNHKKSAICLSAKETYFLLVFINYAKHPIYNWWLI